MIWRENNGTEKFHKHFQKSFRIWAIGLDVIFNLPYKKILFVDFNKLISNNFEIRCFEFMKIINFIYDNKIILVCFKK